MSQMLMMYNIVGNAAFNPKKTLEGLEELGLSLEAKQLFLSDNAQRIFNIS